MKMFDSGCFSKVMRASFDGGFFGPIVAGVRGKMLPYQWQALNDAVEGGEKSFCIRNFRIAAGLEKGEHGGFVFQDSDLAKWLEAVAYQLLLEPDQELEALADGAIRLIEQAQMADGYVNTYYQLTDIAKRWTNLRDNHELYSAGHMIEAAVAYWQATGKDSLLRVMERMADHIMTVLGPEEGKIHGYPGHEEIELALCKLYDVTGKDKYLRLAEYFINERGKSPRFFAEEQKRLGRDYPPEGAFGYTYAQHHLPVREQETVEGHAVRALYLMSGMADVALRTGDEPLLDACRKLYRNLTLKRMYITGGVGSSHLGEAFTFDYDLPSDTAYAETCASIALIFFCRRMLEAELKGDYADTMQRALYNTCLAGMSFDMQRFFYVNPLSVDPEASRRDDRKKHVLPVRPKWFGCACCPPNLARLLSSLALYAYSVRGRAVCVHLYIQGEITFNTEDGPASLRVQTEYPRDGQVEITLGKGDYDLMLLLPGWCKGYSLTRDGQKLDAPCLDGYLQIPGPFDNTRVTLRMEMPPRRVYAHEAVSEEIGKVALQRGPVVYCLEEKDNGASLHQLSLPKGAVIQLREDPELPGSLSLCAHGLRQMPASDALYADAPGEKEPAELVFIPYYAWANRGENEMEVWMREG